jgi:hypothetical protein
VAGLWLKPAAYGAETSSFAAASPLIRKDRAKYYGSYIVPGNELAKQTDFVLDEAKQDELWNFAEKFLKELGVD